MNKTEMWAVSYTLTTCVEHSLAGHFTELLLVLPSIMNTSVAYMQHPAMHDPGYLPLESTGCPGRTPLFLPLRYSVQPIGLVATD